MISSPLIRRVLLACLLLVPLSLQPRAQRTSADNNLAPGAPGQDAQWTNAGKAAVGTSNTLASKVWFTLQGGALTEVYYPTVDKPNVQKLELIIVHAQTGTVETETRDTTSQVIADKDSLSFTQINTAKSGEYKIIKEYTVDPQRNVVLIRIQFRGHFKRRENDYQLYVYYDPSLNNGGMHDTAWTQGDAFLASDGDVVSALVVQDSFYDLREAISKAQSADYTLANPNFSLMTNGFLGVNDGLTQLQDTSPKTFPREIKQFSRAQNGNVVQVGELSQPAIESEYCCQPYTLALGFGGTPDEALSAARASLKKGFAACQFEYQKGWKDYLKTLRKVRPKYQRQFDMAAMVLKAHEDKTFRGAMIASLSIPWGGGSNANEPNVGGYHLVWARDLYQVASAFYALGDKASADRALDYLFRVQQKPDGSFPQNSWLDGRPFWGSLQMDEVSYPLILAYQLGRTDNETWAKHVRPAADFLVRNGPRTPQERWEEKSGYSPSTIAAEIAGLVCAAEVARRNDDQVSAGIYLAAADDWARNVERWTATTTGVYGDKNYYLRLTDNDDPNDGSPFNVGNGGGTYDEREIVDAGFLELVRLGIKSPTDPLIAKSVAVVNQVIKVDTPNGEDWYRYNHDGYGEMDDGRPWNFDGKYTGKGRLWALLAGERGQYELARNEVARARTRLDAMMGFANEGLMIPEQVWDATPSPRPDLRVGEGTGSATPLAWSMAQFIRLAANLQEGRNLDTPDIVAARYARQAVPARATTDFDAPSDEALMHLEAGKTFQVRGRVMPKSRAFILAGGERRELSVDERGAYTFNVPVERGDAVVVVGTVSPNGATSFERVMVHGLSAEEKLKEESGSPSQAMIEKLKSTNFAPLVDGEQATFVYRGAAKRVEVVGDFTNWRPGGLTMRDVPGTNVKYYTLRFPKTTRAEYKLIADGEWLLDPLNHNKVNNGVGGENSFLAMPDYRMTAWLPLPEQARGKLERLEVPSRTLGGTRKIQVYLPHGYAEATQVRYPVLYVQDGSDYIARGSAVEAADQLIAGQKLAPFIIVFVDPVNRMKEYWADDAFADFMAGELVPFIDSHYRTRAARDSRALLGASLGGVISVWTALRHPEVFARVGGQSTAFQIGDERTVAALSSLDETMRRRYPLKFYFDVGRLEPILGVNRRVQVMLAARSYRIAYRETEAGHNYSAWRDRLADAYTALWSN